MQALLNRLANRVRLTVGRALLAAVNDASKLQATQVQLLEGETRSDVEHFQHYGFTSVPFAGAEGVALAVGGSRDHVVLVNVDDRRYRVKSLANGEVCVYTDEDGGTGLHRIHFKRGNVIEMHAGTSSLVMTPTSITLTSAAINLNQG